MPTPEELALQITDLEGQVTFLQQRITSLSTERSNLEVEISQTNKAVKAKLDSDYDAKVKALESEYKVKSDKQLEQQKYLDEYLVRLDKQSDDIKEQNKALTSKIETFNADVQRFAETKESALSDIADKMKEVERKISEMSAISVSLKEVSDAHVTERINLDAKISKIEEDGKALSEKEKTVSELIETNGLVLGSIMNEKEAVIKEKAALKEVLDSIQKEKEEAVVLSIYKDELKKIQDTKTELEEKRKVILANAALVDKREASVAEREEAATDKEKYLEIKERDVIREMDKRIAIIKKLKEGDNA